MLLLTRRCGESIRIEDDVVVRVLKIKGNVVLLGVKAPRTVPVHREEIYEKIQQELRDKAKEETVLERVFINDCSKSVLVRRKPMHKEKEENRLA